MTDPDDNPTTADRPPASADLEPTPTGASSPLPFEDLRIPTPTPAAPPLTARILAFGSILVGGLLGGLIGYGTADLLSGAAVWVVLGLLVGAVAGAVGVGVVAGLTLRAMNEWKATVHPEAAPGRRGGGPGRRSRTGGQPGRGTRG